MPKKFKDSTFVFLANTAPALQSRLLGQVNEPFFVAADTMSCWIEGKSDEFKKLLKKVDALVLNEQEARLLAGESNLIAAAGRILDMGPQVVIVKKGGSGSIMCGRKDQLFALPAFPLSTAKDPTGAGDSFAGAFMGYLAQQERTDFESMKMAVAYGTVAASFAIADFSLKGLASITRQDIEDRLRQLRKITQF